MKIKICLKYVVLLILYVLTFLSNINALTYFVDDMGLDGNLGTLLSPWQTIQKAVNRMSTNVTTATCYILPGTYIQKVIVASNKNLNYMVISSYSNSAPAPVLSGNLITNYGITISNTSGVIIRGLKLKKYFNAGLRIIDNSSNNILIKNEIYSNEEYGLLVKANKNLIATNSFWGMNQFIGLYIISGNNNIIQSNQIYNNQFYGLSIISNSSYNLIIKNNIINNLTNGLVLIGEGVDNNYILSNQITGNGENGGLYIQSADKNLVEVNNLSINLGNGITIDGAAISNTIFNNEIYSNINAYGILINSESGDNNSFISNRIWGANMLEGIVNNNGDNNYFYGNRISQQYLYGIELTGSARSNYISHNIIYSNVYVGIGIMTNANLITADYNYIASNMIFGQDQPTGILLQSVKSNLIYRNLINKNKNFGIQSVGSASGNKIINNTIFKTMQTNGIQFEDTSSGFVFNNIIFSNKNFGIKRAVTSGNVIVAYNDIYLNGVGMTNGGITWGGGNISVNPIIDIVGGTFNIISSNSSVVDAGIHIPGITDGYSRNAPDMGWNEFLFSTLTTQTTNTNRVEIVYEEDRKLRNNVIKFCHDEKVSYFYLFKENSSLDVIIYDITGDIIKQFRPFEGVKGQTQIIEWDGKDDNGKCCGVGYYIMYIKQTKEKLKIIIY